MVGLPKTRPSLLARIRHRGDGPAWSEFVSIYAPLLHEFFARRGLQDADARDLVQDCLMAVSDAIKQFEYSSNRGPFRAWLFTIAVNRLRNHQRSMQRDVRGTGDTSVKQALEEQPDSHDWQAEWETVYERHVFHHAALAVRGCFKESTWNAFWQTAVEGRAAKEVAEELNLTPAAVYLAKGRVTTRIKEQVQRLRDDES